MVLQEEAIIFHPPIGSNKLGGPNSGYLEDQKEAIISRRAGRTTSSGKQ